MTHKKGHTPKGAAPTKFSVQRTSRQQKEVKARLTREAADKNKKRKPRNTDKEIADLLRNRQRAKDEKAKTKTQKPQGVGDKIIGGVLETAKKGAELGTKIISSPKTTIVLGSILAGLLTFGTATGPFVGTGLRSVAGSTLIRGVSTRGGILITGAVTKFATNTKNIALTKTFLEKTGLATAAIGTLVAAIGTYPFAGFIKEEALQTISFAFRTAQDLGDIEGMEAALAETDEILNPVIWRELINAIPFANVLNQLEVFYKAAQAKRDQDARALEEFKREQEEEGEFVSPSEKVGEEIEERDIEKKEDIEARDKRIKEEQEERDKEFEERREKERIESEERQTEQTAFFENIRQENLARQQEDTLFFEAIRKRNAGLKLTDEEKRILESRGASSQTFEGGRSSLGFGLF